MSSFFFRFRIFLPALLVVAGCCSGASGGDVRAGETMRFFSGLGPGWNLGNAFDAYSRQNPVEPHATEMLWGNPRVTGKLFEKIHDAGFRVVRIPVTWSSHMDEQGVVDAEWMERVARVVTEALDSGLYVILNAHHEKWYSPFENSAASAAMKLKTLWTQIAGRFSDFDERLIFEGMNEPRLIGTNLEWTPGTPMARTVVNFLNQIFVNTVRAAPANNAKRFLLVPPYAAMPHPDCLDDFIVPADGRVGVSIHIYSPVEFASEKHETATQWDEDNSFPLPQVFQGLRERYTSRGIPIVVTEYGAVDKNNVAERVKWASYIRKLAAAAEIPLIWWDNGGREDRPTTHTFSLFDRHSLTWIFPDLVRALTGAQ